MFGRGYEAIFLPLVGIPISRRDGQFIRVPGWCPTLLALDRYLVTGYP